MTELDPIQKYFYKLHFENAFLKKKTTGFQEFFENIMAKAYPGKFIKVRPYGNEGDLKCDGYLIDKGILYQVYAPRTMKERELITKIREDFVGAHLKWGKKMSKWVFVHNDTDGLPPKATQVLQELGTKHQIKISVLEQSRLQTITRTLSLSDLEDIFGVVPAIDDLYSIEFEDLRIVVNAIQTLEIPLDTDISIKAPSAEKISKNRLAPEARDFLATGRRREQLVEQFINMHPDPIFGQRLADTFHSKYLELRDKNLDTNIIFQKILDFAGGLNHDVKRSATVLAVISHFFECCDIFEDDKMDL